jgi:hypothetical protein
VVAYHVPGPKPTSEPRVPGSGGQGGDVIVGPVDGSAKGEEAHSGRRTRHLRPVRQEFRIKAVHFNYVAGDPDDPPVQIYQVTMYASNARYNDLPWLQICDGQVDEEGRDKGIVCRFGVRGTMSEYVQGSWDAEATGSQPLKEACGTLALTSKNIGGYEGVKTIICREPKASVRLLYGRKPQPPKPTTVALTLEPEALQNFSEFCNSTGHNISK